MKETQHRNFNIEVSTKAGQQKTLEVKYKETTDGIPFYECLINNQKVQLRKDEKWEQIWGDLSPEEVDELGAAIDKNQ